ncbi:CYTH domain protein [Polystyrenella longa]|uniref:CYTH domain protein n=1 Tax=Polystyrenella longa TaxID=2528007 RepID=A0A518CL31_9PLAN|nr:class IV adenylate cyclase [Polystyrenella longa]QDU79927.1 CYTH domain protein [Polystyrenella longa]
MTYEVELKFELKDRDAIRVALQKLGAVEQATEVQQDHYFNHPQRDFAQTDEAFRIRSSGEQNRVTYKGPILDSQTKTRKEIEIPFASGQSTVTQLEEMLVDLGFRPVYKVTKTRTSFSLEWENRHLEITLDRVNQVGDYLEIETMTNEADRDEGREAILKLAKHLGFKHPERRSYLRLLLEKLEIDGTADV